jgi:hypothetical protein
VISDVLAIGTYLAFVEVFVKGYIRQAASLPVSAGSIINPFVHDLHLSKGGFVQSLILHKEKQNIPGD